MSKYLKKEVREKVINLIRKGKTYQEVSSLLSIPKSTITYTFKRYQQGYGVCDRPKCGRPRKTTPRLDKLIRRKSVKDPRKSAIEISRELSEVNLCNVSRSTVTRRLHDFGLFGRKSVKKPYISKKNQKARLEFAKQHLNWTVEQWSKVGFSDESKYNLFGSDGQRYVRRPVGTRDSVLYQTPTNTEAVMLWFGAYFVHLALVLLCESPVQ